MPHHRRADSLLTVTTLWVACLAALGLGGCERPNSTPPIASADPSDDSEPSGQRSVATKTPTISVQALGELAASGRTEDALAMATELLIRRPDDARVLFIAANLEASRGNYEEAVEFVSSIESDDQAFVPALGQSADWLMELGRYEDAERRYRAVVRFVPSAVVAHRRLAEVYNVQGRRQEAAVHVRTLGRLGQVQEEELLSLISISDPFFELSEEAMGEDDALIGPAGRARIIFSRGDPGAAESMLRQAYHESSLNPAGRAFFGRVLVENQSMEALPMWLGSCGDAERGFADFWFAIGGWLSWQDRYEDAAEAFAEAIKIDFTDRIAYFRLADCLRHLGADDAADWCVDRSEALIETNRLAQRINFGGPDRFESVRSLAEQLEALDRPLEAILWSKLAAMMGGAAPEVIEQWKRRREQLVSSDPASRNVHLPPSLRHDDQPPLDWLAQLPREASSLPTRDATDQETPRGRATFANIAQQVGLDSIYLNHTDQNLDLRLLHETTGGGVAVLDYDLDGRPDLYFTQGAAEPNLENMDRWKGTKPNPFYRHRGNRYEMVTGPSGVDDRGYGQGATAGDYNADGFPDLLIANIGDNRLLINNGDGTFRDASGQFGDVRSYWTTSVALADVDGDHLADVIECNYIDDPKVFDDPWKDEADASGRSQNRTALYRPGDFPAAPDRIFLNRRDRTSEVRVLETEDRQKFCDALALLVTDIDGRGGNDLFVANDMRMNHLWLFDDSVEDSVPLREVGVLAGCAYSSRGDANACMGIASADFDRNGLLDFAVTNFSGEPMNYFVQQTPGTFVDLAAKSKLFSISHIFNGFGTQAIDYDNNGRTDLVVLNGHVHDARHRGEPFRMLPQLIDGSADRFEEVTVEDPSGYWQTPCLGRSVALLDWNRSGQLDLATTHLDLPAGLIENRSESAGHSLQLRLVGTTSERDAIGATVRVRRGGTEWMNTVNTGDGYHCKNEAIVAFGLGSAKSVDRVEVTWPTGVKQVYENLDVDRRWMLVEGETAAVLMW